MSEIVQAIKGVLGINARDWPRLREMAANYDRDTFLIAKLLPATDSPKLCGMIYDAVTAELGKPGSGYDPVGLFYCAQRHWTALYPQLIEAEKDGFQAAKDAGWY